MADDVAELCELLDIDHPVLFGHSAGGFVALHLAIRHPGLPGGLLLCDTGPTLVPLPDDDPPPSLADRAGPRPSRSPPACSPATSHRAPSRRSDGRSGRSTPLLATRRSPFGCSPSAASKPTSPATSSGRLRPPTTCGRGWARLSSPRWCWSGATTGSAPGGQPRYRRRHCWCGAGRVGRHRPLRLLRGTGAVPGRGPHLPQPARPDRIPDAGIGAPLGTFPLLRPRRRSCDSADYHSDRPQL